MGNYQPQSPKPGNMRSQNKASTKEIVEPYRYNRDYKPQSPKPGNIRNQNKRPTKEIVEPYRLSKSRL